MRLNIRLIDFLPFVADEATLPKSVIPGNLLIVALMKLIQVKFVFNCRGRVRARTNSR